MNPDFYHINDDLLVKYLLGEASEAERLLVEEWVNNDVANKKQLEELEKIWMESKKLAVISKVDEDAAWQRFKQRVQEQPKQKAVVVKMKTFSWWRVAALFIVIIGAGYFGYRFFREEPVKELVVASNTSTLIDTLPDGSIVTLNKNSSLNYPSKFKGDSRTIALKGEAFFNVTPDKKKPFIIHVNDVSIRVVGTSFNVRSVNGVTEVIVETGIVQVSRKNNTVELKPKEKVKISEQNAPLIKEEVKDQLYNYYRSKEFVCDDTPLWKLAEVLNEAYGVNIIIENNDIRGYRLTTTFENQPLDRILDIISKTFDITISKEKDKIVLK